MNSKFEIKRRYKVGDKIKIVSSKKLKELKDKGCPDPGLNEGMFKYGGKKAIIKSINWSGNYYINLDNTEWSWAGWMIYSGGSLSQCSASSPSAGNCACKVD